MSTAKVEKQLVSAVVAVLSKNSLTLPKKLRPFLNSTAGYLVKISGNSAEKQTNQTNRKIN